MNISRATVYRLLDVTNPHLNLTLMVRAAIVLNKTTRVELVN